MSPPVGRACVVTGKKEGRDMVAVAKRKAGWGLGLLLIGGVSVADAWALDPLRIRRVGTYAAGATFESVDVVWPFAYLAKGGGASALEIVDISNPVAPRYVGAVGTRDRPLRVTFRAGYAYVSEYEGGLEIFDVRNPQTPRLVGRYSDRPIEVSLAGPLAYVANCYGGFLVLDVSDPALPRHVGELKNQHPHSVTHDATYVYVGDYLGAFHVIDASNPGAPQVVGSCSTDHIEAWGLSLYGQTAYVGHFQAMTIIDVSDPRAPQRVAGLPHWAVGFAIAGSHLYVANWTSELLVLDVSSPQAPRPIGSCCEEGRAYAVDVVGSYVYLGTFGHGLYVLRQDLIGDLNCDWTLDFGDIAPFVLALGDQKEYQRQYPECNVQNADCNDDGRVDFGDVNPFVRRLSE